MTPRRDAAFMVVFATLSLIIGALLPWQVLGTQGLTISRNLLELGPYDSINIYGYGALAVIALLSFNSLRLLGLIRVSGFLVLVGWLATVGLALLIAAGYTHQSGWFLTHWIGYALPNNTQGSGLLMVDVAGVFALVGSVLDLRHNLVDDDY